MSQRARRHKIIKKTLHSKYIYRVYLTDIYYMTECLQDASSKKPVASYVHPPSRKKLLMAHSVLNGEKIVFSIFTGLSNLMGPPMCCGVRVWGRVATSLEKTLAVPGATAWHMLRHKDSYTRL